MSHNRNGNTEQGLPDPEVEPRAKRRTYTSEYKERILNEVDAVTQPGQVGAILRREGLYSQLISKWRQQRDQPGSNRLSAHKRGPKADPQADELARLKRENERLRQKLERAELIIEVQKKVSQMLGPEEHDPSEPKSSTRSKD